MKKENIYKETPEARKKRVREQGSILHTRVVKSKKQYDRKRFKKGGTDE